MTSRTRLEKFPSIILLQLLQRGCSTIESPARVRRRRSAEKGPQTTLPVCTVPTANLSKLRAKVGLGSDRSGIDRNNRPMRSLSMSRYSFLPQQTKEARVLTNDTRLE